jgi:hypothetical protein
MGTLKQIPPVWGNLLQRAPGIGNNSLNAAANWVAVGYLATEAKTLSKVRVFLNKSGTLAAADYRLEVYSDNSGSPGTSLATATAPASNPAGGTFVEWTGLSLSLTPNNQYWLVMKNLNATPASNFFTVRYLNGCVPEQFGNQPFQSWGAINKSSSNSGSSWSFNARDVGGYRLEFADGTFAGLPVTETFTTPQVYGTREWGAYFTSPAADLVVAGVSMMIRKVGTPTGIPQYRIYQDVNASTRVLLGTTSTAQNGPWDTSSPGPWQPLYFSTPIRVTANLPTRVVLSETTQSDASGNRFESRGYSVENDTNSVALIGFKGTLTTDSGSTFTETDTETVPFALYLGEGGGSTSGLVVPAARGIPNLLRYRRGHMA